MSRLKVLSFALSAFGIVLVTVLNAKADDADPTNVDIALSSPVEEILVRESLPLTVVWRNASDRPLALPVDALRRNVSVHVRKKNAEAVVITQVDPNPPGFGSIPEQTRRPNETWQDTLIVSCHWPDPEKVVFDNPGEYEIWIQYDYESISATSNRTRVHVRSPKGRELEALKLARQLDPPGALYEVGWVVSADNSNIELLQKMTKIDEAKVYPSYARLALATLHVRNARKPEVLKRLGTTAEDELRKAEAFVNDIDEDVKTLSAAVEQIRAEITFVQEKLQTTRSHDSNEK